MITRIKLSNSNAYLVRGERSFLIDTGSSSDFPALEKALATAGLKFADFAAVIHTHGHGDHAGCSARLQREHGIPMVIHHADVPLVTTGRNGPLTPSGLLGRIARPFVDGPFQPFQPDVILRDLSELKALGFPGHALHTPGHSEGSISLIVSGEAIVGDIVRGGLLGGAAWHLFIEDWPAIRQSIAEVIATGAATIHPGHFRPFRSVHLERLAAKRHRQPEAS